MGSLILATNQSYFHYFDKFLEPAVGNNSHWLLCWRATLHGFNARQFHSRCDGKNHTVTIVKNSSYVFGGYTDIPWGKKIACFNDETRRNTMQSWSLRNWYYLEISLLLSLLRLSKVWVTKKCLFSTEIFFTVYLFFTQFLLLLFMTDAGRYAPVLRNETLHGRMLLENTVHMSVKVRRSFIEKQYTVNLLLSPPPLK